MGSVYPLLPLDFLQMITMGSVLYTTAALLFCVNVIQGIIPTQHDILLYAVFKVVLLFRLK